MYVRYVQSKAYLLTYFYSMATLVNERKDITYICSKEPMEAA